MTDDSIPSAPNARVPRDSVMLTATVEHFGHASPTRHRVRDLSAGGVRIDHAADFQIGATILVTIGALRSVGATVVWVEDGSAGVKFAQNINLEEARAKAAIAPRAIKGARAPTATVPTAGWVSDVENPYLK